MESIRMEYDECDIPSGWVYVVPRGVLVDDNVQSIGGRLDASGVTTGIYTGKYKGLYDEVGLAHDRCRWFKKSERVRIGYVRLIGRTASANRAAFHRRPTSKRPDST